MSFTFKSAACVAVGTFNIYIVQPNWLWQMGILEKGELDIQADFNKPGFRFSIGESQIRWSVRPDRLVLETKSPAEDCGAPVAKVLGALKWTPIMATGTNLKFDGDLSTVRNSQFAFPNCELPNGYGIGQKTWHMALEKGAQKFNVQVSLQPSLEIESDPKIELAINVHTDVSKEDDHEQASAIAKAACERFKDDCREAVSLAGSLLNAEISI